MISLVILCRNKNISVLRQEYRCCYDILLLFMRFNKVLKYIFLNVLLLGIGFPAYSQCDVTVYLDSVHVNSTSICQGDSVDFYSDGKCVVMDNDFNNGTMGFGWNNYTQPTFSNPCTPHPNGSTYLWLDASFTAPRYLITENFNTLAGGVISFDLCYALQFGTNPCEGPDVDNEGVSLQYSNDNGAIWGDIIYFCPDGTFMPSNPIIPGNYTSGVTPFTSWDSYSFPIPPAAQTPSTRFRWIQMYSSNTQDNWGLDNINITVNILNFSWSHGATQLDPPPVTPQVTTTYTIYVMAADDPNDTVSSDSIRVIVHPPPPVDLGVDTVIICYGDTVTLTAASGAMEYLWNTASTKNIITIIPTQNSVYSVTSTDNIGCTNSDSAIVFVNPIPAIHVINDKACIGDSAILIASGGIQYLWSTGDTVPYLPLIVDTNSLYYVTITDVNGCSDVGIGQIQINSLPVIAVTPDTAICYGDRIKLFASGGVDYLWSNGIVMRTFNAKPLVDTVFSVIVTDSNSCINYDTVKVIINPFHELFVNVLEDTICRGKGTLITVKGASSYKWNTGEITPSIYVHPNYSTYYSVTGSVTSFGILCRVTEMIEIKVKECNTFYIPNAFSPKGINNVFKPKGVFFDISSYSFMIFDKWGKLLFETDNPEIGWDGRVNGEWVQLGVYAYRVKYINMLKEVFERVGTVTVVK